MKGKTVILMVLLLLLSSVATSYCESGPSYENTIAFIKTTMATNTSLFRNESYGYIDIDKCQLSYTVSGTYPAGGSYTIRYNNLDFKGFNPKNSKIGHDYTAFIVLNFNDYFEYKSTDKDLKIRTVVINVSDDEASQALLGAFSHLGELCAPESHSLAENTVPSVRGPVLRMQQK